MRRATIRLPLAAALLALLVGAAFALGMAGAHLVENDLRARSAAALEAAGASWARVQVDGLRVSVAGTAPDALALSVTRAALAAALGRAAPLVRIEDRLATAAPPAQPVAGGPGDEAAASRSGPVAAPVRTASAAGVASGEARPSASTAPTDSTAPPASAAATAPAAPAAPSAPPAGTTAAAGVAPTGRAAPADQSTMGGPASPVAASAPTPSPAAPASTGGAAVPSPVLTLRWDGQMVVAEGPAAGPARAAALALGLRARAGSPVKATIAPAPAAVALPSGWHQAALALAGALTLLPRGEATLVLSEARLTGTVLEPRLAGRAHRALAEALPADFRAASAITVDLPRAVAAVPFTPERCAVLLNAVLAEHPLSFAKAEAALAPGAAPVLDRLAAILGRCTGSVEIGGHTDNRGRASFNEALSRARAEAVREALLARGVPLARLVARGYGESRPIANNDTPEGRARNRRIEFRPASCAGGGTPC